MHTVAAVLVALSFFATHAAGEAFARASTLEYGAEIAKPAAADVGPNVSVIEELDGQIAELAECCPDPAYATAADDGPCHGGDCLFILPTDASTMGAARPGIGAPADETGAGRPGRMVHPPPIV